MRQGPLLAKLFEISYGALFRNLEGITHEESLIFPRPAGNCLNWVLGHLLASRNRLLPLIGVPPVWPLEVAFLYSGIQDAEWSPAVALDFRQIQSDLAVSQQMMQSALDEISEEKLATVISQDRTVAMALGFLLFHESYHGGQVALLRRLLGKEGVIRAPAHRRRRSDAVPKLEG